MTAIIRKELKAKQRPTRRDLLTLLGATLLRPAVSRCAGFVQNKASTPIQLALHPIPFRLETDETLNPPHAPATMAGGVAVFDYNQDGSPDIYFTNGANIATLKKDMPKFSNRLFRNNGNGAFTDVTGRA
ncbi:MAG: FG-GAP repeat domain-containing protein, partial [Limisphaerales bacterium]